MKICEAPDHSPKSWGHKCNLPPHTRQVPHLCDCGHVWSEVPVDTSKVRTVPGDLTL